VVIEHDAGPKTRLETVCNKTGVQAKIGSTRGGYSNAEINRQTMLRVVEDSKAPKMNANKMYAQSNIF